MSLAVRRGHVLPLLFAAAAIAVTSVPAHAGLHLCNQTSESVTAAVGIVVGNLLVDENVSSEGWYQIEPGQCATPVSYDLSSNTQYYYYAHGVHGAEWGSSTQTNGQWRAEARQLPSDSLMLCVDPQNAFNYGPDANALNGSCPSQTYYMFLSIPNGSYTDYTLNINP